MLIAPRPYDGIDGMGLSKNSILLLEDDADLRDILAEYLTSEGYFVISEANGELGLLRLWDVTLDLVVSDLEMSRMAGDRFIAQINALKLDIPVVLMSRQLDIGWNGAKLMGASYFLEKPFSCEQLKMACKECLRYKL